PLGKSHSSAAAREFAGPGTMTPGETPATFTPPQRLLSLAGWQRSGLPAGDFAPLVGLSRDTLYQWKKRFETPAPPCGTSPAARPRQPPLLHAVASETQPPGRGARCLIVRAPTRWRPEISPSRVDAGDKERGRILGVIRGRDG